MSRKWKWILGIAAVVIVLAVLGNPDGEDAPSESASNSPASEACLAAFEEAASVSEMQDTVSDLYPALQACQTLEAWAAASEAHPDALDGTSPEVFARNACRSAPAEVRESDLCSSLSEG